MMKMSQLSVFFATVCLITVSGSRAGELDPKPTQAPEGLIVRVSSQGQREVYKAELQTVVNDAASASQATTAFVNSAHQIKVIIEGGELDHVSSVESWYNWYNYYNPYHSYYGCNWYGNSYYYYPSYNWYNSGYYYYYYYRY